MSVSRTAATLLVRFARAERESRRFAKRLQGLCGGGKATKEGKKGTWCIDSTHKGRGLIHRGGRTRLYAVVERISFIAILDERDQPVTRLPRESQGRESTEFPLPRPRGTRDNRESNRLLVRHVFNTLLRRIGALVTGEKRSRRVHGCLLISADSCTMKDTFAKIGGYRDDTNSIYRQLTTVPYESIMKNEETVGRRVSMTMYAHAIF